MTTSSPTELILLSALRAQRGPKGGFILTQKYLNGVEMFAKFWPGETTTLLEVNDEPSTDMDHVEIMPRDLPYDIEERPTDEAALAERLKNSAAVLAFLSPKEAPVAELCRRIGVPLVYVSEYSLQTEKQIIDSEVTNPLRRMKRKWAAGRGERIRIEALRIAAGIQCSGSPTYEVYKHVNPNAMVFFDNRVRIADVISTSTLAQRTASLDTDRPLRLVFGGRLIAMKGVDDLPYVARELVRLGVPFTLDVYGKGALEQQMKADIVRFGLQDKVFLKGVLDFEREWIPMLKREMDLFVCCHPQGDPSCTYPEVMSCGVPIAGYDNEAFVGIVQHAQAGWLSPLGKPDRLAAVIAKLHNDRKAIADAAVRARDFAIQHAFENTFAARAQHLGRLSRLPEEIKGV